MADEKVKVNVIFHSMYGHCYKMAQAAADGAKSVEGTEVKLLQVPETLSDEILEKMGATETKKTMKDVPVATMDDLPDADAIVFGTPIRFGNMSAQMRAFLDRTGGLWAKNALVDKIATVFTSSGTQHGGQESTILSFHITLLHHGMLIAGLPYTVKEQSGMDEIHGGSPYGASTICGPEGEIQPRKIELEMARKQAKRAAELAKSMKR